MPGPGEYDVSHKGSNSFRRSNENHEKNIQKARVMSEKRLKTLPKLPDMGTYDP